MVSRAKNVVEIWISGFDMRLATSCRLAVIKNGRSLYFLSTKTTLWSFYIFFDIYSIILLLCHLDKHSNSQHKDNGIQQLHISGDPVDMVRQTVFVTFGTWMLLNVRSWWTLNMDRSWYSPIPVVSQACFSNFPKRTQSCKELDLHTGLALHEGLSARSSQVTCFLWLKSLCPSLAMTPILDSKYSLPIAESESERVPCAPKL